MSSREKVSAATEKLVETMRGSYETVVDHASVLQGRNVRFARGVIDAFAKECRQQAGTNRAVTQELVEQAKKQHDALRMVAGRSLDAYIDLLYLPLSYYKEGLKIAGEATK
jgi:hypothetical protein